MTIFRIDMDKLTDLAKERNTKSMLKDLGGQIKRMEPRMTGAVTKATRLHANVAAALKKPDADSIELLVKACKGELAVFAGLKKELDEMQALLGRIEEDEAFVADRVGLLLALTKGLSNEKIDCAGWMAELEGDRRRAETAAKAVGASDREMGETIEQISRNLDKYREVLEANAEQFGQYVAKALEAGKSGDRVGYSSSAETVSHAADADKKACEYIVKTVTASSADFKKKFGARAERLPILKDMAAVIAQAQKASADLERSVQKVKAAEPAAIDVKRAAKVLQLEKYQSELGKLLAGPPSKYEQGLEAIAKKAGQNKATGRQLLESLVKARAL